MVLIDILHLNNNLQHNFKKLRNNLLKSTNGKTPRHFILDEKEILWSHLRDAYMYDIQYNPVQTFKYLSPQHFDPTSAEKMRNHLADDVLGKRMLEVLKVCFSVVNYLDPWQP